MPFIYFTRAYGMNHPIIVDQPLCTYIHTTHRHTYAYYVYICFDECLDTTHRNTLTRIE